MSFRNYLLNTFKLLFIFLVQKEMFQTELQYGTLEDSPQYESFVCCVLVIQTDLTEICGMKTCPYIVCG